MAIPQIIKKLASMVRGAEKGSEVRESIAKSMEETANVADETKTRQDSVEAQFQAVIDETTGKDIVSAPEILASRVSATGEQHDNLKERLDSEYNKVNANLAQNTTEHENFESQLAQKPNKGEIISSHLSTIRDEDRLGLVNLKEEVIQAMAGETEIGNVPENGSVTIEKLAPELQTMFVAEGEEWGDEQ